MDSTILSTFPGDSVFGMPQVLLRFMAIRTRRRLRNPENCYHMVCNLLVAAVFIDDRKSSIPDGTPDQCGCRKDIYHDVNPLSATVLAGLAMAGILAATISSSDSYLLIASSAVSKNIYQGLFKKQATDKQVMRMSRIVLLVIALIGIIIAMDENSIIFKVVAFAWAGFGATFGPIMLFSLFWKRTNRAGAIWGMLTGGIMVFVWKKLIRPMGGIFGIYELLPAFILSCIVIVIVSLLTKKPDQELLTEFEQAKAYRD
jgi:sodium/proline symporter